MASDATQIGVRVPDGLLAEVDDLAARMNATRTHAVLLLLVNGFQLDRARRSWHEQGDAVAAVQDFVLRDQGEPLTPENARGRWQFEGVWYSDERGDGFVLEAQFPDWWQIVAGPPAPAGGDG